MGAHSAPFFRPIHNDMSYVNPYTMKADHPLWETVTPFSVYPPVDPHEGNGPVESIAKHPLVRAAISETLKGNTNKTGKKVKVTPEAAATWTANFPKENAMSNPEHVEKVRQSALRTKPCPNCNRLMNAGNLSRHIKKCL